jgi:GntP family gluconate:H+ symporter
LIASAASVMISRIAVSAAAESPVRMAWATSACSWMATGFGVCGILAPLVSTLSPGETSLLVLAIGAGSLFFSHVNDYSPAMVTSRVST